MTGRSYSEKANTEAGKEPNWAEVADNAAKKAEQELDKIKRDAKQLIQASRERFNNPNENE